MTDNGYEVIKAQVTQAYAHPAWESIHGKYRSRHGVLLMDYQEFAARFGFVTDTLSRLTGVVPVDLDGSHTAELSRTMAHAVLDAFGISFDPDTLPEDERWRYPEIFPGAIRSKPPQTSLCSGCSGTCCTGVGSNPCECEGSA